MCGFHSALHAAAAYVQPALCMKRWLSSDTPPAAVAQPAELDNKLLHAEIMLVLGSW